VETHRRGSDGRRIFSPEFKREQIGRVVREELTMAESSRELEVQPSVIRRWKHLVDRGSTAAAPRRSRRTTTWCRRASSARRSSAFASSNGSWARRPWRSRSSRPREMKSKKAGLVRRVHAMTGRTVRTICRVLGIGRATVYRPERVRGPRYARAEDRVVTTQIHDVIRT